MLGRLVKVTPSSKVVGDLALHLVGAGVEAKDFEADPGKFDVPDSVIGFLRGELGDPPGGWPEPFRTRALEGRPPEREHAELSDDDREGLAKDRRPTLNRLLFPGPTKEFLAHRETYGDTSVLSTQGLPLRPGARGRAHRRAGAGRHAAHRARGDLRARRARLPHGRHVDERAAAPGVGARRGRRHRRQGRGEGRHAATRGTSRRRSRAWSRCRWPRATRWSRARPWRRSRP